MWLKHPEKASYKNIMVEKMIILIGESGLFIKQDLHM